MASGRRTLPLLLIRHKRCIQVVFKLLTIIQYSTLCRTTRHSPYASDPGAHALTERRVWNPRAVA